MPTDETAAPPRPFLLIQTRPEDDAALGEAEAVRRLGGYADEQLTVLRLDQVLAERAQTGGALPLEWDEILRLHAGVILPGSPFTTSVPAEQKSEIQRGVEAELARMLDVVIAEDLPFLGCCYGIGTLGAYLGAQVDGTYGESAGPITVTVTDAGTRDPLLAGLPASFAAYVGHKEAITALPEGAEILVRGTACPVQMFRIGTRQYATQFHPELDQPGLMERLRIYAHHGYFDSETAQHTFDAIAATPAPEPPKILENF
ncbi:MAG: glutamine amidotransferase, partial [Micrococcus sp.]|nr:glutamine amidotransferase [Micrococcus sp.]